MPKPYVRAGGRQIHISHHYRSVWGLRLKVHGRITFTMNSAIVREAFRAAAFDAAEKMGDLVLEKARHNVAPGVGPGPHPHISRHVDTGELMRSLFRRLVEEGNVIKAEVGHPARTFYGSLLEFGWHTSTGRFVRYPWLLPAIEESKEELRSLVWHEMKDGIARAHVPSTLARQQAIP